MKAGGGEGLRKRLPAWGATAAVYVFAAVIYILTAGRGPAPGDWGDFVSAAAVLGIAHPTGYATFLQFLALPILALPAPWAAAAADITGALLAAAAPAALTWWLLRLGNRERCGGGEAAFGAVLGGWLATLPAFWIEATSVEVYAAGLALLAVVLVLLEAASRRGDDRFFTAAVLVAGLGLGIHLTSFTYVALALAVWAAARRPSPRTWGMAAAAALLGLSTALYLPLRAAGGTPLTWKGIDDAGAWFHHIAGRQFSYNFRLPTSLLMGWRLKEIAAALWNNAGPLAVLAPVGLWVAFRRSRAAALAVVAIVILNLVYLWVYDIPDLASYQLTAIALAAALACLAGLELWRLSPRRWLQLAVLAVAAAALVVHVAAAWPRMDRNAEFAAYYTRNLLAPQGYGAAYASGTTNSNFLFWYERYVQRRRPDVEFYNMNDQRFDFDTLAARLWSRLGAQPVFVDYHYAGEVNARRSFFAHGRAAGFVMEVCPRATAGAATRAEPFDREALAAAAAYLAVPARGYDARARDRILAAVIFDNHTLYHQARREEDRAAYYLLTVTRLAPDLAVPWVNLAGFYFERGAYDRTRAAARRALLCRDTPDQLYGAYAYLALADRMEGRFDDALKHARMVVALKPHDGKTHRLLAGVLLDRGDKEEARAEMERTLARGYRDPDTVLMLAALYREEGREEDAFALLGREAHRYYDADVINAYALALIERGRYLDARNELERAARLHPEAAAIRENLARLRMMGY